MKYRSRSEIICAVLWTAERGATKTRILYGASLSYHQMLLYLDFMMDKQLLCYNEEAQKYDLTGKGLRLLHLLEYLEALMAMPTGSDVKELRPIRTILRETVEDQAAQERAPGAI